MKQKVILIGGGGHAASVLDVLLSTDQFEVVGFVDRDDSKKSLLGVPYLGEDSVLEHSFDDVNYAVMGVGQIDSPELRIKIAEKLTNWGYEFPVVVSPNAFVSSFSNLSRGTVVHHGAFIGPEVNVGSFAIVNSSASIDHGVRIGDYCHISTGAVVNGDVSIGNRCFVGSNSVIKQGLILEDDSKVSMGAALLKNTKPGGWYLGNPARKYKL